ncbi:g4560 [Coccomyxa elongata]
MSQEGAGEKEESPQVVGPGDPAMQEEEIILKYNVPAAPPGAHKPRATGSDEYAPLDADAFVGPAGATTGPAGKVPSAFEKISKRRMSAASLSPFARGFSSRIEVNPAGGRAVELDLQDDSKLVVDAAVEQFSNGQAWPNMLFDEHPTSQISGFGSGVQQNKAGQAQADSMGTGGFLNPPPGQTFDEAHTRPDIQMQGDPGTIKGAKLDSADADGALEGSKQTIAGHEQAEGMGTGGSLNPPPGEVFTGGGLSSVGKDDSGSSADKGAATLKDPNYSVGADSSFPSGARGFFSAPAWFSSAVPAVEHGNTTGAGAKKDSYGEVKHLPDTPEPVDAGTVTDLQTGVNVIGGTPVKTQADRMTHPDRLNRETESMQPEVDPVIEKVVSQDTTKLAGRPH